MRIIRQNVFILIFALTVCLLCSSCRYKVPDEKRVDVISDIAEIVNDNYTSKDIKTPLYISITEIDEKAGKNSDLHGSIEKYRDIQQYHVYLLDNNVVLIITDALFQSVKGYVISDEELDGTLTVQGLNFDSDRITIIERIENSNIYSFSAGQ